MTKHIWIEFPGEPMPAARWKTTSGKGKQFKKYRQQWNDFREWASIQMIGQDAFINGERLVIEIHIKRKNHIRADIDNLFKAITDPLNGIVYGDDAQIDVAHVYIERGVGETNAGVVIEVLAKGE